jgi:molybdate transport system substrate-binding protein
MNVRSLIAAGHITFMFFISGGSAASAAEIKVLSANAMQSIMEDLRPKFEQASGHKLAITFATLGEHVKRVQAGETADVTIIPYPGIETSVKDGKVAPGNVTAVARSSMGVAIRKGAAKQDISSPEALKQTLLAAKSITYSNPTRGGTSGPHLKRVFERLGIADEMNAKTVFLPGGGLVGELVAKGQAEIAIHEFQQLIQVSDIEIIGPLPGDLQNTVVFAAAIMGGAKDAEASKALINFLRTPEAAAVIKAKGMEPATP